MIESSEHNPQSSVKEQLNLPSITVIGTYEHYQQQKRSRKDIEKKRKMLQEAVSALRREAEQSARSFRSTQDDLMYTYNKKLETLDLSNKKREQLMMQQKEMERKKNFSSLTRYLHQVKKQQAIRNIMDTKKAEIQQLKSFLDEKLIKKQKLKHEYMTYLKERNKKMSDTQRANMKWARQKSLQTNRKASKSVRNSLISIQQNIKSKQAATIQDLEAEKQRILNILTKNKQKKDQILGMKNELDSMDLYDFESSVVQKNGESRITVATRKISRSKRKSRVNQLQYYN